jgi:hypothetical protein
VTAEHINKKSKYRNSTSRLGIWSVSFKGITKIVWQRKMVINFNL